MNIKYIDLVGFYGPIILNITSIILLWNKPIMWVYIEGSIVSVIINSVLKIIIKEPRPDKNPLFKLAIQNKRHLNPDIYGMPSGHSQSVGFSCAFIYLSLCNFNYFLGYLAISIITMTQRFTSKSHSILQIIIGFILGILIAYLTTVIYKQFLIKKLEKKKDDECYI